MPTSRIARSSGVLLHPTSLPGPFGVGDLGPAAHAWVDTLAAAGQEWRQVLGLRKKADLRAAAGTFADDVDFCRFGQFLFARQWAELRVYARQRGVKVIGDLPIYVAADSADVWAHPALFILDTDRRP